jgi:hypothetical protein
MTLLVKKIDGPFFKDDGVLSLNNLKNIPFNLAISVLEV